MASSPERLPAEGPGVPTPEELNRRTAQGAFVSTACQVANLGLRVASMMILARLLTPEDFGLVGMVMTFTGFVALIKEAGLSDAAVQSASLSQEQMSTLFWISVTLGCGLALICAATGHAVAGFYGEPRLVAIMLAMATSFVFTGLATQHRAVLARSMRIRAVALIEILALFVSIVASIALAMLGLGYWALVGGAIVLPACSAAGVWLVSGWVPGRPRRNCGVGQLLRYGGTVTLNSVVVYVGYNAEKVLLGRLWGAEALGIYGRAYQLVSMPTESLKSAIGLAAFPALSRVQGQPDRFRSLFIRLYSAFLSLSLPITAACALFAEDIVLVLLGSKWQEVTPVFRLLSPTILAFALINPFGWLLYANGRVARSLKIALLIAPVTLVAFALGVAYGPQGVAVAFSAAMLVLVAPVILWSKLDTTVSGRDVLRAVAYPAGSVLIGSGLTFLLWPWVTLIELPLLRLVAACSVLFGGHLVALLVVFRQASVYSRILQQAGLWRHEETVVRG